MTLCDVTLKMSFERILPTFFLLVITIKYFPSRFQIFSKSFKICGSMQYYLNLLTKVWYQELRNIAKALLLAPLRQDQNPQPLHSCSWNLFYLWPNIRNLGRKVKSNFSKSRLICEWKRRKDHWSNQNKPGLLGFRTNLVGNWYKLKSVTICLLLELLGAETLIPALPRLTCSPIQQSSVGPDGMLIEYCDTIQSSVGHQQIRISIQFIYFWNNGDCEFTFMNHLVCKKIWWAGSSDEIDQHLGWWS